MPHSNRGPKCEQPILFWRFAHEETVPLRFCALPGVVCDTVARYSEVLLLDILCEQWERDADLIEAHRGFVHIDDLAERYARRAGKPVPTRETIRQYFHRLRRRMEKAAADQLGLDLRFELIENKRGVGYRIGPCGLRIEDTFRCRTDPH
jgi:hypothetical protein